MHRLNKCYLRTLGLLLTLLLATAAQANQFWNNTDSMANERYKFTAVIFTFNDTPLVLVAGGKGVGNITLASAERMTRLLVPGAAPAA